MAISNYFKDHGFQERLLLLVMLVGFLSIGFCQKSEHNTQALQTSKYTNPIFPEIFADPAVLRAADGLYYAYGTQASVGGSLEHIQIIRSKDLIHWERLGDALPDAPAWGNTSFWAPHVLYDAVVKKYYLYYSAESTAAALGKCLGVAVSDSPAGPFVDKGEPLICGADFVNIDPMAFDDPKTGKKLLFWGSGFQPIKVRELAQNRIEFKKGSVAVNLVAPGQDKNYNILIEGAWVVFKEGWYYLFYSGDNCCGDKANYAVMVARAKYAEGPYQRLGEANGTGNSVILERSKNWEAPGHNSVITDDQGQYWIVYHAIDKDKPWVSPVSGKAKVDRRVLMIDRLSWQDGWPYVEKGPSSTPQTGPAINSK